MVWQPTDAMREASNLSAYMRWLETKAGLSFDTYASLWAWSTDSIEAFWESIWTYFDVQSHARYRHICNGDSMPGVRWFEGSTLNYAEHIFRNKTDQSPAFYFIREGESAVAWSWATLEEQVRHVKQYLLNAGVKQGDRVAAYLPNIPEAIVTFLAVNALGAVWSCCSPDFGTRTVIDRFSQVEPVMLFAIDGYRYGGKTFDRKSEVEAIRGAIGSIKDVVMVPYIGEGAIEGSVSWGEVLGTLVLEDALTFRPVPFDHPIWILYSSGTTGVPKAITHSHGGVLLEHLKYLAFHNDVRRGEHFFWFTTTGWMMWNFMQASMLLGAVPVLYDGSPAHPSLDTLWEHTASLPIHHFGTSAPFLTACMKEGLTPGRSHDLKSLRSIGSTGAPLPPEAFDWVYEAVSKDVWLCSMSGGTDVCTAFVGGCPTEPVYRGRIQCRGLGCAMQAYDPSGAPVVGQLGEMVVEKPMPSMPVYFWNDPDHARYRDSYFSMYPGTWRHGDWIKIFEDGSLIIQGRSDATLNRKGVRIGTAELYAILDGIEPLADSLVLNLEKDDDDVMLLFVIVSDGGLDDALKASIKRTLRTQGSPRHVPDHIIAVPGIPYTLSGKKMEVPVKKILLGQASNDAMNRDAIRNPEAMDYFITHAPVYREAYL